MAFIDLLFGALTAFAATALGAAAVMLFRMRKDDGDTVRRASYSNLMAFCAGVMTFTAVEMFRESRLHSGAALAVGSAIVGILLFFVFEKGLPHIHFALRKKKMDHSKKKAALIVSAIAIHNIPEGFAIAAAFAQSMPLGWLVTLSIALQDVPEGLIIAATLVGYGLTMRRSFHFGVLSGVVEGAAAIAGYVLLSSLLVSTRPLALGLSAGVMIYVVTKELLPDAFRSGPASAPATYFGAGVMAAFAIASVILGF